MAAERTAKRVRRVESEDGYMLGFTVFLFWFGFLVGFRGNEHVDATALVVVVNELGG